MNKVMIILFETSHAKGQQDAAGGCVKNQTDLAIIRGTATVHHAHDLFRFAKRSISIPKSSNCNVVYSNIHVPKTSIEISGCFMNQYQEFLACFR